jgi:hypothetical protein
LSVGSPVVVSALDEDEPPRCISFGISKASTAIRTTTRTTRISFLFRSAAAAVFARLGAHDLVTVLIRRFLLTWS